MPGYLKTGLQEECCGCEACVQICPKEALTMKEDVEGFRYPLLDKDKCVNCGLCHQVCQYENPPNYCKDEKIAYGGYHKDTKVKANSTSGGAFSAIAETWCDENYIIFGAISDGLQVYHSYITQKSELEKFQKSKYTQSIIGSSYNEASQFLKEGKKVLFSGTPCQIAGLKAFLKREEFENLLTIEVICEGVPTPYFMRSYDSWMKKKYDASIESLDYRYKDMKSYRGIGKGKWDFEVMLTRLENGRDIKQDRWFNPFWAIWLDHLMSRPSCYECPYTTVERNADISLGDLWGVHLYCPELYGHNAGASLMIGNTKKGKHALKASMKKMHGHVLPLETALKYQSPMRKHIDMNPKRSEFMKDILVMEYPDLCKKWSGRPSLKLLVQKYIFGNRQNVWLWNFRNHFRRK